MNLVVRFFRSNHESHEKEHKAGKVAKSCLNFVGSWFPLFKAQPRSHTKHTKEEDNTKNSPPYKRRVAAASADGVVLFACAIEACRVHEPCVEHLTRSANSFKDFVSCVFV